MAKTAKLKDALNRHKGVDHKLEHQKKLQKKAAKRKQTVQTPDEPDFDALEKAIVAAQAEEKKAAGESRVETLAAKFATLKEKENGEADGWETDEESLADDDSEDEFDEGDLEEEDDDLEGGVEIGQMEDESDSDSENEIDDQENDDDSDEEDAEEEDIPLSDIESLASEDRGDIIPHQRLTINNTAALQRSLKSFALPSTLPFSTVQAVVSAEPVIIADIEDDIGRESAFYKQSLEAVVEARLKLKKEGVPFSRPTDYFAEMVKSEEQMGKVKAKLVDTAARQKASADAKRQRDLKKFGKAVQVAKLQERDKAKRDMLDKVGALKRKRAGNTEMSTTENDMFDVALEDAAETEKRDRAARRGDKNGAPNRKRQKKDEKFGFGGKKRFAKSNDSKSTNDMSGFKGRSMKMKPKARPGKSRRAAGRG